MNRILFCIATLLIAGCIKTYPPGGSRYSVKATINGKSFNGINCKISCVSGLSVIICYSGYTDSATVYPAITLVVPCNTTGNFIVGNNASGNNNNEAVIDSTANSAPTTAATGTVTVTSVAPDISGKFNFTCVDGTRVINGTFTAKNN